MKIICSKHGTELVLDGEPMLFCGQYKMKCPEQGCFVKIVVAEKIT